MRLTDPDFQNYLKTLDMRLTENLGIPKVKCVKFKNLSEVDFLGFNYCTSDENVRKGGKYVHFFLPDHYIERVWNNLDHYEGVFNSYRGIVQPDFSLYTDMPRVMQMWQHYRRNWVKRTPLSGALRVCPRVPAWP